ncbi:uncharacterized protein N7515_003352 [Penicillium bovifimosum]|uniref:Uncharacterized protein n=1 Tax=Penicillium bovifimosum TaxID=126998 RepID=A0A9W9H4I4_9EURO|nr:uncharacterized protein N7515_003352 [Penicillium bovifimosum]KAJ5138504.1 hypothetical protein N7515_003352 [Penicillium bovifimosum]
MTQMVTKAKGVKKTFRTEDFLFSTILFLLTGRLSWSHGAVPNINDLPNNRANGFQSSEHTIISLDHAPKLCTQIQMHAD